MEEAKRTCRLSLRSGVGRVEGLAKVAATGVQDRIRQAAPAIMKERMGPCGAGLKFTVHIYRRDGREVSVR